MKVSPAQSPLPLQVTPHSNTTGKGIQGTHKELRRNCDLLVFFYIKTVIMPQNIMRKSQLETPKRNDGKGGVLWIKIFDFFHVLEKKLLDCHRVLFTSRG